MNRKQYRKAKRFAHRILAGSRLNPPAMGAEAWATVTLPLLTRTLCCPGHSVPITHGAILGCRMILASL